MIRRKLLIASATAGAILGYRSAPAQTTPATPPEAGSVLQEVVITAQKRVENLQDVPVAVTAVSGEQLRRSGVGGTLALDVVTPDLTSTQVNGFLNPHIRGVGALQVGPGQENSVALYVDGVYISSGAASLMSLIDVSQVSVLKGPQGTLFGRNASAGVIQVTTRDPSPVFGGQVDIGYGDFQTYDANLYLTGPIAPTLAADLAVHGLTQNQGYGRNLFNGEDVYRTNRDIDARSKWNWTPSDATAVTLALDYEETVGSPYTQKVGPGTQLAIPLERVLFHVTLPALGPYDTDDSIQPFTSIKSGGASLRIVQNLGFAELRSISAWRRNRYLTSFSSEPLPVPITSISIRSPETEYSQELTLVSTAPGRVKWVGGLYALKLSDAIEPVHFNAGPLLAPIQGFTFYGERRSDAYAAYGQATLTLTDADRLTFGARYTQDTRTLVGSFQQILLRGRIVAVPPTGPTGAQATVKRPSWRVVLDHHFTPGVMAYVSYSTGFKSGGYNIAQFPVSDFRPETLYAAEIGLKLDVLEHRLRLNSAAFYYDYQNPQIQTLSATGTPFTQNGGSAKSYGLDSQAQALLAPGLTMTAGLSLVHDYFVSFPDAQLYTPVPVLTPTGPSVEKIGSAAGKELPYTATAVYSLGADYRHALAGGEGSVDMIWRHSDGYPFTPDNIVRQGAYGNLNASLSWSTAGEGLTATLWGRNLTNEIVLQNAAVSQFGFTEQLAPPRTYGITLSAKF